MLALGALLATVLGACSSEGSTQTGAELAADVGCSSCHTGEDTELAPSWHGLLGATIELEDGTSVTVDEEYLRRSIVAPDADVVEGYRPTMPTFELTSEEIRRLVDYIAGLGE